MTPKLYAFTCGTVTGEFGRLMEGGEGDITLPIPVYLIEHPKGPCAVRHRAAPRLPARSAGRLGERLAELFRIAFAPGEEVSARLKRSTAIPSRSTCSSTRISISTMCGGNALIPNATMLVQRREWDAGMDAETAARRGYNPRDFDLGHKLQFVDGEHDVFGDGSVVCLPTHGHTRGTPVAGVRLDGGDVVLAADACYFCRTLRERRLPRNVHDRAADAGLARSARSAGTGRCTHVLRP